MVFEDLLPPFQLFASQYAVIERDISEDKYLEICKDYLKIWQVIKNHPLA